MQFSRGRTLVSVVFLMGLACCHASRVTDGNPNSDSAGGDSDTDGLSSSKCNVVVFLADDQPLRMLQFMPLLSERLLDNGVKFINAFATSPLCCPDRASLLSGGYYSKHTGVLGIDAPNGGAIKFPDRDTIATRLQAAGYRTCLIGKYLNAYSALVPYVPPGWTRWVGSNLGSSEMPNWFEFDVTVGSSMTASTQGTNLHVQQYVTDFYRDQALQFVEDAGDQPFFLYIGFTAPHRPATPATGDEALFGDLAPSKTPRAAYGEVDLSDKPQWVRDAAVTFADFQATDDEHYRNQLRSLQAVDRTIEAVMARIESLGKLEQTVFIYTSDNGFLHGEHRLFAKNYPYEESIRVPLIIRAPNVPARVETRMVSENLDVGPTIYDVAGVEKVTDGVSLLPLLLDPTVSSGRTELYIEGFGNGGLWFPSWVGIRTESAKYVEYGTGEKEYYDLINDPAELVSQHASGGYHLAMATLADKVAQFEGLLIQSLALPPAQSNTPYVAALQTWGGTPPYQFSIDSGSLPTGLALNSATGVISGTPTTAQCASFIVKATDATPSSQTPPIGPQAFLQQEVIVVDSASCPSSLSAAQTGIYDVFE